MHLSFHNEHPTKPNKDDYTDEEAIMLNKMHKERIKLSDAILVVNYDASVTVFE